MIGRCLAYVIAGVLSLSVIGLGLVELLFRWQVKPQLELNRASQERHYQPYLEDIRYLAQNALVREANTGQNDAGPFLNAKLDWTPRPSDSKFAAGKPLVPLAVREDLLRLRGDWMRKFERIKRMKVDLSIFNGLARFDHWDIERASPIAELIERREFVPPPRLPVPDPSDLLALVKLRLMTGAFTGDHLAALSDVRQLAMLLMTTENTQLIITGLSVLDHERAAYRFYVDERKMEPGLWIPVDRNVTRRSHRALQATRAYLYLWTRPEKLESIFLRVAEVPPYGFCAAANEAFPLVFSVRSLLEPRWPMEMSLRYEYDRIDAIFARARQVCRLRYVGALADADAFQVSIPGPLVLNRLPYARKVFGLRVSVVNFSGFDAYDNRY